MGLLWIVLIMLLVFAFIGAPNLGIVHHKYGYYPSGMILLIAIILLLVLFTRT